MQSTDTTWVPLFKADPLRMYNHTIAGKVIAREADNWQATGPAGCRTQRTHHCITTVSPQYLLREITQYRSVC